MRRKLLGETLITNGMLNAEAVTRAVSEQLSGKKARLGAILLEHHALSPEQLAKALALQAGLEVYEKTPLPKHLSFAEKLPLPFFLEHRVAMLAAASPTKSEDPNAPQDASDELSSEERPEEEMRPCFVLDDPTDLETMEALRMRFGSEIDFRVVTSADIDEAMEAIEEHLGANIESLTREIDAAEMDFDPGDMENASEDALRDLASEAPIIRMVNLIITRAAERRASDIHIELFEHDLKVRYRIDGVLHEVETLARRYHAALVSRVKLLANLDIAERRIPQDGRVKLPIGDRDVDMRVATTPTIFGENIVIRLLDKESVVFQFERLGFPEQELRVFRNIINQPYGTCIVTGPTGSGKSTTLYTVLSELNTPDRKIITIEDPVEMRLPGVNQIQVNTKVNLTFARGLRSIVRQDPNIIMVGEIRDPETAEVAIQSALTGHMVFSTLHTNDAAGSIARLADMGVERYLISSALTSVLAQRLVRRICPHCRRETTMHGAELADFPFLDLGRDYPIWEKVGCEACEGTGFRGRVGLYELMVMNDELRAQILRSADARVIRDLARANGMRTLREAGWEKIVEGFSTLEEVRGETQVEDVTIGEQPVSI